MVVIYYKIIVVTGILQKLHVISRFRDIAPDPERREPREFLPLGVPPYCNTTHVVWGP